MLQAASKPLLLRPSTPVLHRVLTTGEPVVLGRLLSFVPLVLAGLACHVAGGQTNPDGWTQLSVAPPERRVPPAECDPDGSSPLDTPGKSPPWTSRPLAPRGTMPRGVSFPVPSCQPGVGAGVRWLGFVWKESCTHWSERVAEEHIVDSKAGRQPDTRAPASHPSTRQEPKMMSSPWSESPSPIQAGVARIFMRDDSEALPVYDGAKASKPRKHKGMVNKSVSWISRCIWILLVFCT